ncbi:hypothetical protein CHH61_04310 [Shouchella clausii]|uniref:Uncharacterized protein n=1 Tax=Shouchella clausii TaxID=79880 RepID=A0A268S6E4_SHOCL|nr:hypothetical protein [Shouchella clausii]PAF27241.1 hypothetical protein CHH61_04310 [Shouchella clausii]
MVYSNERVLFSKRSFFDYKRKLEEDIQDLIVTKSEDYILGVDQAQYVDYLFERFKIENVNVIIEKAAYDRKEEEIAVKDFPYGFYITSENGSFRKNVYYISWPFTNDPKLFDLQPSTYDSSPPVLGIQGSCLTKRFIQFGSDIQNINQEVKEIQNQLNWYSERLNKEIDEFNEELPKTIKLIFEKRKSKILKTIEVEQTLIIPIKQAKNVPETFTIPSKEMKKKIPIEPKIQPGKPAIPEPTLSKVTYFSILKMINDMGKEFERKPSVYSSKAEEHLRDHFLMLLEPQFEGSATGETFNRTGKTDILLRYKGSNVFVAECKFWRGKSSFLKTIDQLLGYLTWRDSKVAIIMFVENKDFSNVLNTATESIKEHSSYIKKLEQRDETWLNYLFSFPNDSDKKFELALMLYHIPKI